MYRIRNFIERAQFDRASAAIFQTPPAEIDSSSNAVLVSQLCRADVRMFLVAIKSFCRHVKPKRVYILNDSSLTRKDKDLLSEHIESVEFADTRDYVIPKCPQGICWERLGFISSLVSDSYVLQLDADTITCGSLDEVTQNIQQECSFTLGSPDNHRVLSFADAAKQVANSDGTHVQILTEKILTKLPSHESRHYIRGCAAFAGFARGAFTLDSVIDFSTSVSSILGLEKWNEWGSDQICSNVMVANSPKRTVLPDVKYVNYDGRTSVESASFVHFRGTHRFKGGVYSRLACEQIALLRNSTS